MNLTWIANAIVPWMNWSVYNGAEREKTSLHHST
jgi:hypothetical protein